MMSATLAEQLRAARTAAKLTQKQLGELLSLSHAQVSRIESGERETTPETLSKWLEACGYRLDVIPLATTAGPSRRLAAALAAADDEGAEAAVLLLRVWPSLTARDRRLLMGELRVYEGEQLASNSQGQ